MTKTAISFKVPEKLWNSFKAQTDELFLSRAPFLDYMVQRELTHLREDLAGLKLSTRAKRRISGELKRAGAKSKNIEVDPKTADALRAAMTEHNLVRDAFMCRLIIFLRSTDALLNELEIPRHATSKGIKTHLEDMPSSPLRAMEAVRDDPLFYIRNHLRERYGCGVYGVRLPEYLDWAACYLDDELVRGTRAHRRKQKEDKELFALLDLDSAPAILKTGKDAK
ncbi:MAG TPA: hypothetical protein PLX20_00075 [Rhodocyclaceae bacterium]|nr:hypothetical protein [Rhodocyclaceae bacterium]HNC60212.1 hypothetical protein [Rhodocyclaceae bacterium]HNH11492.1 hypothetical protein [Rhodocyclaceae bacterium]